MLRLCLLALVGSSVAYAPGTLHPLRAEGGTGGSLLAHRSAVRHNQTLEVGQAVQVGGATKSYFSGFSGGVEIPLIPQAGCTSLGCLSVAFGGHLGGSVSRSLDASKGTVKVGGGFYVQLKLKLALVFDAYISLDGALEFESECNLATSPPGESDVVMPTLRNWAKDLFRTNKAMRAMKKLNKAHKKAWKDAGIEACASVFLERGHEGFPLSRQSGAFLELDRETADLADFQAFHDSLSAREQLMMYEEGIMDTLMQKQAAFVSGVQHATLSDETNARRMKLATIWFDSFLNAKQAKDAKEMMNNYYKDNVNTKLDTNLKCDPTFGSAGTAIDILVCRFVKTLFLEMGEDSTTATIADLMTTGFLAAYPDLFSDNAARAQAAIENDEPSDKFVLLAMCPENFQAALAEYDKNLALDSPGSCTTSKVTLTGQFSAGASLGFAKIGVTVSAALVGTKVWARAATGENIGKMVGSDESGWALELDAGGKLFGWVVGMKSVYALEPRPKHEKSTYTACVPCQPTNRMVENPGDVAAPGAEELQKLYAAMSANAHKCGGTTLPAGAADKEKCKSSNGANTLELFKWIYSTKTKPFWAAMGLEQCASLSYKGGQGGKTLEMITQLGELALAIANTVIEGFAGTTALPTASYDSQLCVEATIGKDLAGSALVASRTTKVGIGGGNFGTGENPVGVLNLGAVTGAGDSVATFEFTAGSSMEFK